MTKEFKSNHYMWAWLSPACPVGAFSYSQGLESAINDGLVQDIKTLKLWLSSNLQYGSIKNDSIFIVSAYRAKSNSELSYLSDLCVAFCISSSREKEVLSMGRAFSRLNCFDRDFSYPVALGKACKEFKVSMKELIELFLHACIQNQISAAQRLMALGQTDAFGLLIDLFEVIDKTAVDVFKSDLKNLTSTAFISDIQSMRHEQLNTRLFAS